MFPDYFIGAGDAKVAPIDADGNPTVFRDCGEVTVAELEPTVEFADNFATGKDDANLQDLHVPLKKQMAVMLTFKERTAKNLELALYGEHTTVNAATFSAVTPFAAGLVAGNISLLPGRHTGISALDMEDSTGVPVPLVEATHYKLNADAGMIEWLSFAGLTQPIIVNSYAFVEAQVVKLLSKTPPEICVLLDLQNLAVAGQRARAIIDRVQFAPATKVSLKSGSASGTATEADTYEMRGVALIIPGKGDYGDYRAY